MPDSSFAQRYFELSNADPYIQSVARPGQTIVKKMPFEYGVVIGNATTPLAIGATVVSQIITLADSDFIFTSLAIGYNLTVNSDLKFNRNLTIQIQDTATGKTFYNLPTVTTLVAGGGGFPFVYPCPRVIRPNTGLQFTAANRDTATAYFQMFVTLGGTRIFYAGS